MEEKTVFEKIISGEIPKTFLYTDDHCVAFLDISPINKGHALVVPRHPFKNLYEIPEALVGHLFSVAQKIARAQKETLAADGVNIIMNNDAAAGQEVFHAHIHVIPRYNNDGYEHWHSHGGYHGDEELLTIEKIKQSL